MTRQEIDDLLHSLAHSQGFYGRLVNGHYGDYDRILDTLVAMGPKEPVDVILALEG